MSETNTIHFISGATKVVPKQVADHLKKRILDGDAKPWQVFSDEKDKLICMVNLIHIEFID